MHDNIIEIRNLCKSYGSFRAVDNLNFEVNRGDIYGFLGPNGAGKSTTIRMLLTLIRPDSGEIRIFGKSILDNRKFILSQVGAIVEKPDFYSYLSAKKNIEIFSRLSGALVSKKRIDEIFELTGLKGREHDKAGTYSHGMKQRLGLAQTLVHDPQLIILDEPTTGLDPQGIIDIRNLILHLGKNLNKTIFLSSHILSEIELIATRMVIINNGKAVVEGSVETLLNASEMIVLFRIQNPVEAQKVIQESLWINQLKSMDRHEFTFHMASKEITELNKFLCEKGIEVTGIESRKKLEAYFLQLLGKN